MDSPSVWSCTRDLTSWMPNAGCKPRSKSFIHTTREQTNDTHHRHYRQNCPTPLAKDSSEYGPGCKVIYAREPPRWDLSYAFISLFDSGFPYRMSLADRCSSSYVGSLKMGPRLNYLSFNAYVPSEFRMFPVHRQCPWTGAEQQTDKLIFFLQLGL